MGYPKKAASYNQMIPHLVERLARFAALKSERDFELPCASNEEAKKMRFQFYGYLAILDKGSQDDKKRANLARELMISVKDATLVFSQKNTLKLATSILDAMERLDQLIQTKETELGITPAGEQREQKPFLKELRSTKPPAKELYTNLLSTVPDEVYNKLFMIVDTLPDPYAGYISRDDLEKVFLAEIGMTPSEWNGLEGGREFLDNLWAQLETWK